MGYYFPKEGSLLLLENYTGNSTVLEMLRPSTRQYVLFTVQILELTEFLAGGGYVYSTGVHRCEK
jgi:hypothetical protein